MLIQTSTLASGSVIDADLCLIGGGPAALTVAEALDGTALRVAVLETGGPPGSPAGLSTGLVSADDTDFAAPGQPLPRFGGAANEWIVRLPWMRRGVRMVPLSPSDLETRPWVDDSGWPFDWEALAPWYSRAESVLGLAGRGFDVATWEGEAGRRLPLERSGFTTRMEQFCRSRLFTADAFERLSASRNIAVYLGARVGEIDGDPNRVLTAAIDSGSRHRITARAATFVLAAGGIENARQLLTARGGFGLGNQHDNVGRYYMDHLRLVCGRLTPTEASTFDRAGLYSLTCRGGEAVSGKLTPTRELMERHHLLHSAAALMPKPHAHIEETIEQLRTVAATLRERSLPQQRPDPRRVAATAAYVARTSAALAVHQRRVPPRTDAGWSTRHGNRRRYGSFEVELQVEQAPVRTNRVRLADRFDCFGRPLADLRWRWSDIDLASVRTTSALLGTAFAVSGVGTLASALDAGDLPLTTPAGSSHPTGSTRAHADSRRGVVDANLRVHGVENLFVVGSSVFPTSGYANPTLTIVALALRLAQHLAASR